MLNLSAIAEENSAATQEITAAMEKEAASVAKVANASDALRLGHLGRIIG